MLVYSIYIAGFPDFKEKIVITNYTGKAVSFTFFNGSGGSVASISNTGLINSTGYLLNGNNLFSSLTTNSYTKWDGTKFVDAATPTSATNLSYTPSATNGIVVSDTGTDATIPAGSTTNASLMLPADKTKLDGLVANTMTTGWVAKWDGTKFIDFYNPAIQQLSGTTPTWNVNNGVNATLTTSGNTSITLSNLVAGNSGTIFITNPITAYYIKFVGRTCDVKGTNVTVDTSGILCSGGSKHDSFGWYYNGTTLQIHVALDYTRITW